jgi:hypothetical protein
VKNSHVVCGGIGGERMLTAEEFIGLHGRLIEFPNSLCAKLMKAKYFPNGDLLDTTFPLQTSPTWKAIMHGLELLKKGMIWRVADGTKIKIWRHHWLPRAWSLSPIGNKRSKTAQFRRPHLFSSA